MLIAALSDYYETLRRKGLVLPIGYSKVKIHYKICLSDHGEIKAILPLGENEQSATKSFVEMFLPARIEKTAIAANDIEHRGIYIFGLESKKSKTNRTSEGIAYSAEGKKATQSHEAFKKKNLEFIRGIDSPIVNAYRHFIERWKPEEETENEKLLEIRKFFHGSYFVFALYSDYNVLLHEDPNIIKRIESSVHNKNDEDDAVIGQCAILGKELKIARIHKKIKGLYKGKKSGNVLVGFNNKSETSHGVLQSYNSNISEEAMLRYTESLNYLLSSQSHKKTIGDLSILYWANSPDESSGEDLFTMLLMGNQGKVNEEANRILDKCASQLKSGSFSFSGIEAMRQISKNTDFFIVGLKPNASRVSLKFVFKKRIDGLFKNIIQHQVDLSMSETPEVLPLRKIEALLENAKVTSKEKIIDPAFYARLLESVVNGTKYPELLLQTLIRRMKFDGQDATSDIFMKRSGLIKAFLNREQRLLNKEEEYTMALNTQNNNPAYLCGRLFALLEKLQLDSASGTLNRTIRDSYFASASSKPSTVFPKLLRLSQHHFSKLKDRNMGNAIYLEKSIDDVFNLLESEFPEYLQLREQGKFMIGYYQQMKDLYTKKGSIPNEKKNGQEESYGKQQV